MIEFCKNFRQIFPNDGPIRTMVTVPSQHASRLQVRLLNLAQEFDVENLCISFSQDGTMHFQCVLENKTSRISFCQKANSLLAEELEIPSEITLQDLLGESHKLFKEILPIYRLLSNNSEHIQDICIALENDSLPKDLQVSLKALSKTIFAYKTTSVKVEF